MKLIISAMQSEIKDIIPVIKPDIHLLVTGVGKVNAAMKLAEVIQKESIEVIINLGFAGASGDYHVGDVVLIDDARYHDFDLTMFGYQKGQVPGNPPYFESDDPWYNQIITKIPELKTGHLLTGDCFMTQISEGNFIYDMEGAAFYQVAHHYHIPIISVKVVSDVMGMDKHLESYQSFEEQKGSHLLLNVYQTLFGG